MAQCGKCKTEVAPGRKFCTTCGAPMAPAVSKKCAKCGSAMPASARFCSLCGYTATESTRPSPPPAAPPDAPPVTPPPRSQPAPPQAIPTPPPRPAIQPVSSAPGQAASSLEKSGPAAAIVIFILGAILAYVGWIPLALPVRMVSGLVPKSYCSALPVATFAMYVCSAKVALLTLLGPLLVMVVMFLMRKSIMEGTRRLAQKAPAEFRFLTGPLVATACFTMAWAAVHYDTSEQSGLVPQKMFPAVIGLYTYCVGRYGPALQSSWQNFFDTRDRFPQFLRVAATSLVPMLISLAITAQERVSQTALKEQFVVLVSLCCGYLALAPRQDVPAGASPMAARSGD